MPHWHQALTPGPQAMLQLCIACPFPTCPVQYFHHLLTHFAGMAEDHPRPSTTTTCCTALALVPPNTVELTCIHLLHLTYVPHHGCPASTSFFDHFVHAWCGCQQLLSIDSHIWPASQGPRLQAGTVWQAVAPHCRQHEPG